MLVLTTLLVLILSFLAVRIYLKNVKKLVAPEDASPKKPISVNYHFTRKCNYECGFCFHTAKTSYILPLVDAKRGIKLLAEAGMKKINFAGGEPFLYPKFLGKLVKYCKEELQLESVSIVTNGSLVKERWLETYAQYLDIMAVSCDSFDETTNTSIGRGKGTHLETFVNLSLLCRKYNVKFKVNTVVCRYNFNEDMNAKIEQVAPFRWKCFQVLVVPGENDSSATLRNAQRFVISDEEYEIFCRRHQHQKSFVPESNAVMKSSYLILDEYMRFLNKGVKEPTKSILEVGVPAAFDDVYWDDESFVKRGGEYDWQKEKKKEGSAYDF
ncbi:radical S-adenosyl methionine domain-containing protein 2 [Physcia stellaris]|nr:radical S-adenosyl methionine domain-containing protein 2 [Physcia stellaris]